MRVGDVVQHLEKIAPPSLAEPWDNVGLLLGNADAAVTRVMTCLTVTPRTVAEAVAERADLIVSHHPILFHGAKRLDSSSPEGRLLWPLMRHGVAVFSAHTAFDNCPGGINDLLCQRLELGQVRPLRPRAFRQVKIVVFVPESDLARVSDALFEAGAGIIGEYSQCSFRVSGLGTFYGSEGSHPTLGQKGRREQVQEWRLEVVCDADKAAEAIRRMKLVHSYEEPAFDVYPLEPVNGRDGIGRLGELSVPQPLHRIASHIRSVLSASVVRVVGDPEKPIQRVAVVCGSGGELLDDTIRSGAELLVTGELRFHQELQAHAAGLALVLPGHYATERPGVEHLAEMLRQAFPELTCWASRSEADVGWFVSQ
jgi:dinuclear metal center YbgI/SA1388 family protein